MASKDDPGMIEILKAELDFLEDGGYGRSVRTPWKSTTTFLDSPTCLNFGDPERTQPCDKCPLIALVPAAHRSNSVPCHHIPLTAAGDTVSTSGQRADQQELEQVARNWLHGTIRSLEQEKAETA